MLGHSSIRCQTNGSDYHSLTLHVSPNSLISAISINFFTILCIESSLLFCGIFFPKVKILIMVKDYFSWESVFLGLGRWPTGI